ncbi:hypothetical protein J3R82DRAFT_1591 [Butyriboletus roseoflavus]|nr:hypothetical protein J3R82DRAFT_1591 [Butyriboletus roseoflavus]
MQFRFNFTFFLTALFVLLTWTSLAQGAAIKRDTPLATRDLGEEARAFGADVANADILRRDGIRSTIEPEGESLVGRDRGGDGGFVEGSYNLEERNEEIPADDNGLLSRRYYTLVEIAETEESE